MALKLALILQAVDRLSGPAKKAAAGAQRLTQGARALARSSPAAARALDRVSAVAARMPTRLKNAAVRVKALAGRAGMKGLELAAKGAGTAIGTLIGKAVRLGGALASVAVAGGAFAGGAFLGGIISTTAKFEQFQIMLEGTEGSAAKAKAAMAWVRSFAKATPYELEQVMEAFVQLKAYGIDPLDGSLRAAGDAAAGMSKPLMQAVEALADAQTGEFERLKEFGIRARQEGDRVVFSYQKNGREIQRTASKNGTAIRDAITGIWSDRFDGMMDRQSRTFNGLISNLKDGWTDFMVRVGQAGIFDRVKASAQRVLDWLTARLADGSIDKWATEVSQALSAAFDWAQKFITQTNWKAVGSEIASVAGAVRDLGRWLAWVVEKWEQLSRFAGKALVLQARVTGLDKLAPIAGWLQNKLMPSAAAAAPGTPQRARGASDGQWQRALSRQPALNLRAQPIGARGPQKVQASGTIKVELSTAPGTQARLASVQQTGDVPIRASMYRGGAMARPA